MGKAAFARSGQGSGTAGVSKVKVNAALAADLARGDKTAVGGDGYDSQNAAMAVTPSIEGAMDTVKAPEAQPGPRGYTYLHQGNGHDLGLADSPQARPSVDAESTGRALSPDANPQDSLKAAQKMDAAPVVPGNRPTNVVDRT